MMIMGVLKVCYARRILGIKHNKFLMVAMGIG